MAGVLPGVEHARRRSASFKRTSSFCSYGFSSSYSKMRNEDEKLVEIARKAKERLDERLSAQWNSKDKRSILRWGELPGVFGLKKSVSKRFSNWAKFGWKASEQQECAICLEKLNNNLMQLLCAHRFHSNCLVPWLHSNSHCPCCRMQILNIP